MHQDNDNIILKKSYSFSLDIINIYKLLVNEKREYVISKQLLRCGTSIGANIHEAISGESKRDFIHKLGIAVKEARETSYWLSLLKDSGYITHDQYQNLFNKCNELIKILNSIILTTKKDISKKHSDIHNS